MNIKIEDVEELERTWTITDGERIKRISNQDIIEHINKKIKWISKAENKVDFQSIQKESNLGEIKKESKLIKNENEDEDLMSVEHQVPEVGFSYPLETDASDMLDEVDDFDSDGIFPTVTERYFTPYYELDIQKPGDDICTRIHSNRICMISLAPSHIIFQENKTIVSCDFKVSDKLDKSQNKVCGKSKHGAQPLQTNSNLCRLTCSDESTYMVKCCMIGKLVEINWRLIQDPELLKKEPHDGSYIAIALPNLKHLDKLKERLLTKELYLEALKKREEKEEVDKEIIKTENIENKELGEEKIIMEVVE